LVVDGGGCYLLPRRIGMQKAKEMAFFGERLSASEAFTLGLVNRVVSAADFDATVADFAGRLAGAPTTAIAFTKRLLNDSPDTDRSGAFVAEAMAQEIQSYSHDSKEGVQAFVEKRPTDFTGW
ncbi:MAG: enoyl-CoA hydratase-related protein, partial [Mycobacterium sp.]